MKRIIAMLLAIVMLVGNVPVQVFATEGQQETTACTTEGCEYTAGHEGNCSNFVACDTEGCEYAADHEGNCSNFVACATEGCEYATNHEGNCSNYVEPSADETSAQQVIDQINAIGEVTLESEGAIAAADTAYNALTDAQKALVTNLDVLDAAKASYAALNVPTPVDDSDDSYTGIYTQEDLAKLATAGKYQLMNDIALSEGWTAVSTAANVETVFDGNGHTITLNGTALFNTLMTGTIIKNLVLDGGVTKAGHVGSLAYAALGGIVKNCASYADVTYTGTYDSHAVGGLVGALNKSASTVENCLYKGTLTAGSSTLYGAVANNTFMVTATVNNCLGIGVDRIGSVEGMSNTAMAEGNNTVVDDESDYNAADHVAAMNANIPEGCLTWGLDADGKLVPGGAGGSTETPGGGSGEGDGEEEAPAGPAEGYTGIYTQEDLAKLATAGKYQLMNDITLEDWTPISTTSGSAIVLDGNGHTITLTGTALFNTLRSGDTVCNLILDGTVSRDNSVGSLAYAAFGATVQNCASYADVTYTGNGGSAYSPHHVAGIVGSMTSDATSVNNCLYAGSLTLGNAAVYGSIANNAFFVNGKINNCVGIGSDRIGSAEGMDSHSAIDAGTNTIIADPNQFTAADYVDDMNANRAEGDLAWGLNADGKLVPGGTGSGTETPGGGSGEGDGEEEEPVFNGTWISSQTELAAMSSAAGDYKLKADITLDSSWTAITLKEGTTLDGDGHSVTLNGTPLIKDITKNCVVSNLVIKGSVSGSSPLGSLANINRGTVRNCASYADVTYTGSAGGDWNPYYAAGLIGYANGGTTINCLYAGSFTNSGSAGAYGSISNVYEMASATITNCVGVGSDRLGSTPDTDWSTYKYIYNPLDITNNNTLIASSTGFTPANYVSYFNDNLSEGDLCWGVEDGLLVPGEGGGEGEEPVDPGAATAEDLKALNDAVTAAESVDTAGKVYVPDTLKAFQTALSAAKEVAAAENQKKSAVTKATSDLTAAKDALTERNLVPVDLSGQEVISITTADQLEYMQDGKYYRLDADITLGQFWFAYTEKTMNSVLDGNGHTITLIGKPLWRAIGPNGVVQNLGILGSAQFGGNDTGAFAQNSEGLILNCWSRVTVNSEGQNSYKKNTGGFVANLKSGGAIVNSYVAGSVSMKGNTGTGVQGVFAGTSETNTMVKNGYWLNTVSGNAVGSGDAVVIGCAAKERVAFYSEAFLALLNGGKGEYGKTWTVDKDGWAHLGEDANYEPPKAINLVYTPSEGYGSGSVSFTDESGLQLSLKDCLPASGAEFAQYAGRFSYPDFDGEVAFVPQYDANGLGGHTVFASEDGDLEVVAAGSLEIAVYDKASKDQTYNEYHTKLTSFMVTVTDIQVEALRLVPTGEKVTKMDDDNYSVAGSASVSLKTEIQVEDEWKRANGSLISFNVTGVDHSEINGSLYAKEPGDMNVTASYKDKTDTVKITSAYVPVTSITPSPNGTYVIHGRNANASTDGQFLDLTLSHGAGTVIALPENASYRNSWELEISDESIAYFGTSYMTAIVPVKAGTVTLTAKSTDSKLETPVTGTSQITLKYFNPVESLAISNDKLTVKENESIVLPITFSGPKSADGYHVTEPGMTWSFSGDGQVEIVREPLVVEGNREETDEYFIANDQYKLSGLKAGTVTVTGIAADTTNGEKKIQFTVTVESGAPLTPADNDKLIADGISGAQEYLIANAPEKYELGQEWDVFSLVRSGKTLTDVQKQEYLNSVKDGIAALTKPTDLARVALALRVLGEDPANFDGQNLIEKLYNSDQITNTANEAMWALIALDLDKYNVPSDADWTREALIEEILTYQNSESGGFGLNNADSTSVDMTAMAIQALAAYDDEYKEEVDQAVDYLKAQLNSSCGFGNAEADAQVLVAMSAVGIDILDEENGFVKNVATNLITDITSYQDPASGGFYREGKLSKMPTVQSLYGLEAYRRFRDEEDKLFDLSNIPLNNPSYRIVQGENSTWQRGSTQTVTITANGPLDKFSGVKVGSVSIDTSWYTKTAVEQGTSVTLKNNFLQTKEAGTYAVALIFSDGEAKALLTVTASDREVIDQVKKLIDQITLPITKDSKTVIENAEKAYEDLDDAQKELFKETYPSSYEKLKDARAELDEVLSKIAVSVSVYGHYKHNSDEDGEIHSLANGGLTLWASGTVTVEEDATVLDAVEELLKQKGMSCSVRGGNYIVSITKGGTTLAEFTNGDFSGWKYNLNGVTPGIGIGENTVSDGDSVVVHYTDNYTGVSPATAVTKVIALIKAIKKPITLESKDEIEEARSAYDRLTPEQKKKVTNYKDLENAEEELAKLLIKEVETLINQIGTVTLASGNKLAAAWNAYNDLTPAQQLKVTNRSKLFEADKKYNTLRAEEVQDLIDAIQEPVTLDTEASIVKARKAYDALTKEQKALVKKESLDKLKAAELALAELQSTETDRKAAQEVIDMIDKLGVITLASEEDVAAARKAYDNLTELQRKLVTNYEALVQAENRLRALKSYQKVESIFKATGDYLENLGIPNVGSVGGEWMVIGLARSNRNVRDEYYTNVLSYVDSNVDDNGRLHPVKSTDNSRLILALTAIGKDVTNVGGHNLLQGLNDMEYVYKQGINGPIYALLALDCGNYPAPMQGDVTRKALLRAILDAQLTDGGWALSGEKASPDMTGMALQALAPYCDDNEEVAIAVERGLDALSQLQNEDGFFETLDGTNSESLAQAIIALTALGIDPATDERFIKNDVSLLDALAEFYVTGGGFKHLIQGKLDGMATEQAYIALAAHYRFLMEDTSVFDMTDVVNMGGDVIVEETTEPTEMSAKPAAETEGAKKNHITTVLIITNIVTMSVAAVALYFLISKKRF